MSVAKRRAAPLKAKRCGHCRALFIQTGRRSLRCEQCWPAYRQAVNLLAAARNRDRNTNLTVRWIERRLHLPCPRTGLSFRLLAGGKNMGGRAFNSPSLDQITPGGGYTKRNVQVVVWWYNAAKQTFSDTEVAALCELVVQAAKAPLSVTYRVKHVAVPMPVPSTLMGISGVTDAATT